MPDREGRAYQTRAFLQVKERGVKKFLFFLTIYFKLFLVLVLLFEHVKRFSVSHLQDFCTPLSLTCKKPLFNVPSPPWLVVLLPYGQSPPQL